jgi:hypothetical protein
MVYCRGWFRFGQPQLNIFIVLKIPSGGSSNIWTSFFLAAGGIGKAAG